MPDTKRVQDEQHINEILMTVIKSMKEYRTLLEGIRENLTTSNIYGEVKAHKLLELYGESVDVFGRVGGMYSSVAEMQMDLRYVRRAIVTLSIPESLKKGYDRKVDSLIRDCTDFKDSISAVKQVLEARVRYLNGCQYVQADKVFGDKA